jgi:solute carrier family 25, member 38
VLKSPLHIARQVVAENGLSGLWRGTNATLVRYACIASYPILVIYADIYVAPRNVPGVAMYMTGLTQVRTFMASSPYFAYVQRPRSGSPSARHSHASVLPSLTSGGNLVAGAVTRVSVGFILNPFSVLKARYEVRSSIEATIVHQNILT